MLCSLHTDIYILVQYCICVHHPHHYQPAASIRFEIWGSWIQSQKISDFIPKKFSIFKKNFRFSRQKIPITFFMSLTHKIFPFLVINSQNFRFLSKHYKITIYSYILGKFFSKKTQHTFWAK